MTFVRSCSGLADVDLRGVTLAFVGLAAVGLAAVVAADPCFAGDEALAGRPLETLSRGQPFCTDRAQLRAKVRAGATHAILPPGFFASCVTVPDDVRVEVIEDLEPASPYMHVVKARAYLLFGPLDAYTYSVGLYHPPLRAIQFPPPVAYP